MRRDFPVVASLALLLLLVPGMILPHPSPLSAVSIYSSLSVDGPLVVISEFYPCGVNYDEYIVLWNRGSEEVILSYWTLSDGEGVLLFTTLVHILAGDEVHISSNYDSYFDAFGVPPEITVQGWNTNDLVTVSGSFRLADIGDSLVLRSPEGGVVDSVCYGDSGIPEGWFGSPMPALRQGEVAKRVLMGGIPVDSDVSTDWMSFREYRYGYTEHNTISDKIPAGGITSFASPDCSLEVVLEAVQSAKTTIRVCAYELYSAPFCEALACISKSGVDVRILVDLNPAGGICDEEIDCLSFLSTSGCSVLGIHGNLDDDIVRHIGPLHPKYMVIDEVSILVMSENFVPDGIPEDPVHGNRGWGVWIESGLLAGCLAHVFDDDARRSRDDVIAWTSTEWFDSDAGAFEPPRPVYLSGALRPYRSTQACTVRLHVSPDASIQSPFLVPLLESSRRIMFEQFQSDINWNTRWSSEATTNPLLTAIIDALRNGGQSRGILDSSWFNLDRNNATVAGLSCIAVSEDLDGSFLLMDERSPITILHNKGLILDDRTTVISSNNWVYSSFARNRELAAIVDSEEMASYFADAFHMDWFPDDIPPIAIAGPDIDAREGDVVTLDASESSDDRAIVLIWWDFNGDGSADSYGPRIDYAVTAPGEHLVTVHVEDTWGNDASDTMIVRVSGSGVALTAPIMTPCARPPTWILPLALIPVILVLRRLSIRKLNLGKGGS